MKQRFRHQLFAAMHASLSGCLARARLQQRAAVGCCHAHIIHLLFIKDIPKLKIAASGSLAVLYKMECGSGCPRVTQQRASFSRQARACGPAPLDELFDPLIALGSPWGTVSTLRELQSATSGASWARDR
jgi:hypothetical protein